MSDLDGGELFPAGRSERAAMTPILFDHTAVELDKAGGSWFLTAFPSIMPRIGLRLRLSAFNELGEEFTVHCEVRPAGRTEFQHACAFKTAGFDGPCEHIAEWGSVPIACRQAFLALYERLRQILFTIELARCAAERYVSEPISSRDDLFFGNADDLPKPQLSQGRVNSRNVHSRATKRYPTGGDRGRLRWRIVPLDDDSFVAAGVRLTAVQQRSRAGITRCR